MQANKPVELDFQFISPREEGLIAIQNSYNSVESNEDSQLDVQSFNEDDDDKKLEKLLIESPDAVLFDEEDPVELAAEQIMELEEFSLSNPRPDFTFYKARHRVRATKSV